MNPFLHRSKLRQHTALLTWIVLTGYTFFVILFTPVMMQRAHLLNLLMLGIAIAFQFTRGNFGKLVPLFALLGGFFSCAACTPSVYFLKIWSLELGLPYLLLIGLFIFTNRRELPGWWKKF